MVPPGLEPRFGAACLVALLAVATSAFPEERLVLVGGGSRPAAALGQMIEWAGGAGSRLLVVPWASSEPAESAAAFQEDLVPHRPGRVDITPGAPLDAAKRAQVLEQLRAATGVFFTGGDQGRIMDVLLADPGLLEAFRDRHRQGVVFGGTSAGAAIMSPRMITGNGDFTVIDAARVETRPGLGLLPGTIVDQHFVKRQRENRLFALVLAHPEELGVGIDEGTALLVEDGHRGTVVGEGVVMLVDGRSTPGALVVRLARPGQAVDLRARRVLAPS
jgi:cyanophycinase